MDSKRKTKDRHFRWIWQQTRSSRGLLVVMALTSLGLTALQLLVAVVLQLFTDIAAGKPGAPDIGTVSLLFLCGIVLEGILSMGQSVSKKLTYSRTERSLRLAMTGKITESKLIEVQKIHSGELLTRLTKDVESVANCIPNLITNLVNGLLLSVGALVMMFLLSWKMSLTIIIAIPLLLLIVGAFSPLLEKWTKADKENDEINRSQMQDALGSIPLLKVFRAGRVACAKVERSYQAKYHSAKRLSIIDGLFNFANNIVGMAAFMLVLGYGAYLVTQGEFTIGGMIAMVQLLNHIVWPFQYASAAVTEVTQAIVSAGRVREVLALPHAEHHADAACDAEKLTLSNVHFAYAPEVPVLTGVDAAFAKGRIAGIYGRSGGGKSTLLRIMLGLYNADEGEVCLDGKASALAGSVTYVPADGYVCTGTLRENLLMGAEENAARLTDCIESANLQEVLNELPEGLDTPIGNGGQQLSSGQAQRVAIARALYRDAPVMILDEPTSNLDQTSIDVLCSTLRREAEKRIVIVVTHERAMCDVCDDLYILQEGKLAPATADEVLSLADQA